MNAILLTLCLLLANICSSQNILIPYRFGNKYGISNELGKVIVAPQYDEVEYLKGQYFQYSNRGSERIYGERYDANPGQYVPPSYGVYQGRKLIISNQSFRHFLIYDRCIVGSENPYHPENCNLYNLKGQRLFAKPVKGLGIDDKRDVGNLANLSKKFTLISVFDRNEERNRTFSLAIYDDERQLITGWLVKDATGFKIDPQQKAERHFFCTFADATGYQEKYIRFNNEKFVAVDASSLSPKQKEVLQNAVDASDELTSDFREGRGSTSVEGPPVIDEGKSAETLIEKDMEDRGYTSYRLYRDSLFYIKPNGTSYIPIAKHIRVIYQSQPGYQSIPLLYKEGDKFGLIARGKVQPAHYDSLLYFSINYIACKNLDGRLVCGIIDRQENILVPMQYDSITGMQIFRFKEDKNKAGKTRSLVLSDKNSWVSRGANPYVKEATETMLVYKNGKVGLTDLKKNMLLPVVYNFIAENDYAYGGSKNSSAIVVRKDSLYGLVHLTYNSVLKSREVTVIAKPVLTNLPCFYYNDYYGKKGFKLFGLYSDAYEFLGYANEKGKNYFRD